MCIETAYRLLRSTVMTDRSASRCPGERPKPLIKVLFGLLERSSKVEHLKIEENLDLRLSNNGGG